MAMSPQGQCFDMAESVRSGSDTVLVIEEGIEILTYYPRDLASLIIPAGGARLRRRSERSGP